MKAVRYHGQKDIRLDTVPIPAIQPGWVRVKPAFCGICGSDLHEYLGGPNVIPQPNRPHAITGETLPVIIGHEFSGVVDEVGDGVVDLKRHDKVCIMPIIYDGDCRSCVRGLHNCCDKFGFVGISGWGGGMKVGALVEPLSVGWHAVDVSPFQESDSALVLGGGPIGLAVVLALVGKGCKNIIVSETSRRRREFAQKFGAHHVLDPLASDTVQEVKNVTQGQGVDVGFDAAGVQVAVNTALKCLKARGTLVNIALWEDNKVTLDMSDMLWAERKYMAVATYSHEDFAAVIEAIATNRIRPGPMITKVIKMNEVAEKGFQSLSADKNNQIKILIDVTQPL